MRTSLLVTLGILLASTTPTALASPSALRFDMPDGRLGPDVVVPVNVTLMITDFMCHEPREFFVNLSAISSEGVKATFAKTNLTYTTPAHTYFAEPYRQTQTVNLTVRALVAGQIEITAVFLEHEAGPCLAPDGFQSSSVTVAANVDGPAAPPATQPPASEPAANETSPTPASPTPPARPTAAAVSSAITKRPPRARRTTASPRSASWARSLPSASPRSSCADARHDIAGPTMGCTSRSLPSTPRDSLRGLHRSRRER